MVRSFGIALISAPRYFAQMVISSDFGSLSGSAHLTALVMRQSRKLMPSSALPLYSPCTKPNFVSVLNNMIPDLPPVKGRPVRLAPLPPGASPTISNGAFKLPKDGTGALCQSGCFFCNWRR